MRSLASEHPAENLGPLGGAPGIAAEDVAVAGSKLRVVRQLVSDSSASGAVGKGWRLNWESRLSRSDDGQDAVLLDGGGVAVFVKEGEQLTAKGVGTLALTADGAVLTRDDGGIDTFDHAGRLIERRKESDAAKLCYDTLGQLEEVRASDGSSVKFRHDDSGRLLEAKASDGSSARYGYADAPLPARGSASWSYSYDEAGRLSALNGTAAGETHFEYDAKGRVTSRSWADGAAERFDYDDAQRTVRHTAEDGQMMTSQWSEDGHKLTMTDAAGAKAVQEFNAAGQMVSVTGEKGRATFEYDALGRLMTATGADGAKQSIAYLGATKLPVSITGPDGKRELGYDAQRNLTSIDDGKGRAEFGYDKEGRLASTKLPGGESWNYAYDDKGRRTSATDAQGKVTEFRYDEAGRLAGEKLPDGTTAGYEYSADGRLAAITGADGARRTFAYDATGQVVSHEDSGAGAQALLSRLDQLEASRGTGTAPVPSVPRPVASSSAVSVAAKANPATIINIADIFPPSGSLPNSTALAVPSVPPSAPPPPLQLEPRFILHPRPPRPPASAARPQRGQVIVVDATPANSSGNVGGPKGPRPPLAPTVRTPVPDIPPTVSSQVARGAQYGGLGVGLGLVGTSIYSWVQEGRTADEIADEVAWTAVFGLGAAAAASTMLTPVGLGVAAVGGTIYAVSSAADRAGAAIGVGADRQRAAYEPTEQGLIQMFGIFGRLAELRALRDDIIHFRTIANKAAAAGKSAVDAAQAAIAQLPPDGPPLTQTRVAALLATAQDGATKKSAAGAGAARAEAGLASVTQKLDIVDPIASSASPAAADVERALNLFAGSEALVAEVVKVAAEVNATATALRNAVKDGKSVVADRDAALAKLPGAERLIETASNEGTTIYQALLKIPNKQNNFDELATNLRAQANVVDNQVQNAAPNMRALLSRRMSELNQFVNWKPEPEIATATAFRDAASDRLGLLGRKIESARTFLFKIPSDLAVPSADDEASRATAAATAAQARLAASAALIQKLRSMGAEVVVPTVVNLSAAEAQSLLAAAGFKISWTASSKVPGANDKPGTVEQQNPAANSKAKSGTAVTLTVLGPKPDASNNMPATAGKLKVPAGLPGMTEADAVAKVRAAGFTNVAVVSANSPTPDGKGGTVEQHVPAAGEERDASTTVTLYVFLKPGEAIVPGVQGLTVREAKLQIEGAKLKTALQVSADQPADKEHEFTVQAQSHAKGEKLKEGEVVTLSIYPKFGTTPSNGVPDVVGKKLDDAYALIRSAGLQPGGVTVVATPKDQQNKADTVAQQTPAAGQPIPADKFVNIVAYAPLPRKGPGDGEAPVIPEGTVPELVGRIFEGQITWVADSSGENPIGSKSSHAMFFELQGGKIVATSPKATDETKVTSAIGPEGGTITAHYEWHGNAAITADTAIEFTYTNGVITGRTNQVETKAGGRVVTRVWNFVLKPKPR